jgi:hypothetical protein
VRCYQRTNIDALALGEFLLEKDHAAEIPAGAWQAEFQAD